MTPAQRKQQILDEERQRTIAEIAAIDASDEHKHAIITAFATFQDVVARYIAAQDGDLDARVLPTALAGLVDEMRRVYKRLAADGLAPGSPQMN